MREILAVLTFLAATVCAPAATQATTLRIEYTGAITTVSDSAGLSGFSLGDPITGAMTINFNGPVIHGGNGFSEQIFFTGAGEAKVNTFGISGANLSGPNAHFLNNIVYPAQFQFEEWEFTVANFVLGSGVKGDVTMASFVRFVRNSVAPIISPVEANIADLRSLIVAGLLSTDGTLERSAPEGNWFVAFTVDPSALSVTTTPLPAALPLFASALASLGLYGCRRRRA